MDIMELAALLGKTLKEDERLKKLADLIEAGLTLGQALSALANQGEEDSAQRYVCSDLRDRIVRGENFSDACAAK